eukprot:561191-Pelagomonas_calceolata.AAC.2
MLVNLSQVEGALSVLSHTGKNSHVEEPALPCVCYEAEESDCLTLPKEHFTSAPPAGKDNYAGMRNNGISCVC